MAQPPGPLRHGYHAELDQLRLQVELMGLRVEENLARMRRVLGDGDGATMEAALAADDDIDAMNCSLTERCYDLLARQAPVASDLRFVVSVIRVIAELERVGDLALRIVKLGPDVGLLASAGEAWRILLAVVDEAIERHHRALTAWSTQDLALASEVATTPCPLDAHHPHLVAELRRIEGPEAVRTAMGLLVAGQAADRIADHAAVIGARIRYLVTGEARHLAAEVR